MVSAAAAWWGMGDRSPEPSNTTDDVTPAPPETGTAHLILTGVPLGARITVDGELKAGATFELGPGTHVVRVSVAGYETTIDTVTLAPRQRTELAIDARPLAR